MMNKSILALAAAAGLAGTSPAQPPIPAPEAEASIPFAHQRIRSFRSLDDRSVYIRVGSRLRGEWYYATTAVPCRELPYALAVGVDRFGSTFDRFSTLLVDGERCPLQSLVRSGRPPRKIKSDRYRSARSS
jgi:hypothetical protein